MPVPIFGPNELQAEADRWADLERRLVAQEQAPQLLPPIAHPGRPLQPLDVVALDGYMNITSAAFVGCFDTWVDRVCHAALFVRVPWQTGAGTTGEVRVTGYFSTYATSAVALGAASSGVQTFRWRHGIPLWTADVPFQVEARRTGGASNVRIGIPYTGLVQVDPRSATATGV